MSAAAMSHECSTISVETSAMTIENNGIDMWSVSHLWFSSSRKKANIFFFAIFSEFSQWVGYLRSRGLSLQFKYLPVEVIFYFSHGLLGNPLSIATPELFLFSRLDFSTFVIAGPSSETRTIGRTTSGVQTPSTSRKSICFKLTLELLQKKGNEKCGKTLQIWN